MRTLTLAGESGTRRSPVTWVQTRLGLKISVPEAIAWRLGLDEDEYFLRLVSATGDPNYGRYLRGPIQHGSALLHTTLLRAIAC